MMRYAIIPDGDKKAIMIHDDEDFKEIIRDRLGKDAADYYDLRIADFSSALVEMESILKLHKKSKIRDELLDYVQERIDILVG